MITGLELIRPLKEVDPRGWSRLQRARRFRVVSGGVVKPRLDSGAKGTASWAIESVGILKHEKRDKREAEQKRRHLEDKFMQRVQAEEIVVFDAHSQEEPLELKPEERFPQLDRDSKVVDLRIHPDIFAWGSL